MPCTAICMPHLGRVFLINFSVWLFGVLSLILIYKNLKHFFSEKISLISALAMWLATPWLYYQFLAPSMNHMASLFLVSLFLFLSMREWRDKKKSWFSPFVVFLMILTRWQNLFFIFAYAPVVVRGWKKVFNILIPIFVFQALFLQKQDAGQTGQLS